MRNRHINLYFFLPTILFLLIAFVILVTTNKGDAELYINNRHNNFFDWFFYCITEVGNGWFFTLVAVALLFIRYSWGLFLGFQGILVSICSSTCKHVLFPNSPRPPAFFDKNLVLHYVTGSQIFYSNSFPSGHTMTAFCMCCTLSFFAKNKKWGLFFFFVAAMVALSRMYLLKHFLEDVTTSCMIGTLLSLLTIIFLLKFYDEPKVLQGNLRTTFRKNKTAI